MRCKKTKKNKPDLFNARVIMRKKKRIKKNKMGRHKSWWNNKNLGLWLSRYQYHCTIWLINTIWQYIKNLAKVTKRPLIEVCVEMIMVANLFFRWINVYKIDNHMCCNTSFKIPYPTFSLLFFDFLGVFIFCFVLFFVLVWLTLKRSNFMKMFMW